MARLVSELVVSVTDRASAPSRRIAETVGRLKDSAARNAAELNRMHGQLLGAAAAGYALYRGLQAPIKAAENFRAEMSNVSTLVDTATEDMTAMGAEVLTIARRTPVAVGDLTSALYDVRSAGISAGDAMNVLEGSARLAVAGLGSTGQAVDLVTSSINAFGLAGEDQARLYDVIFKAVKNGKTTISELSQGFGAVAGTVANANIALDEYFASVAALTTTGLPAAQAHTQIRAAIAGLTRETKESGEVFRKLGAKDFKDLVEKSGGMVAAFDRIREALGGNDAKMIKLLGSVEAYNALLNLTTSVNGKFTDTLDDMRNGANSVDAAFEKQNAQFSAMKQRWANVIQSVLIPIGNALIPAFEAAGAAIIPLLERLGELATAFPGVTLAVVGVTAALIGLRVASIGARFAFLWMKGGVLSASIIGLQALGGAATGTAAALRAMRTAATGGQARRLAVDAAASAKALWDQRQAAFASAVHMRNLAKAGQVAGLSLPDATKAVAAAAKEATAARVALAATNAQLRATGPAARLAAAGLVVARGAMTALKVALISTGVGAILVGIAMAGVWIYRNWSGIKEMFVGIGEGIKAAFPGAGAAIDAVSSAVEALGGWIENLTGPIDATSEEWRAFGRSIGETIGASAQRVKDIFNELIDWFAGIPKRIKDAIGSIDISGLIKWPSMPSWLGGGSPVESAGAPAIAGARAAGGPVSGGRTYLVGEKGPELFVPAVGGRIVANDDLISDVRQLGSAVAGGRGRFRDDDVGLPSVGPVPNSAQRGSSLAGPVVSIGQMHIHAAPGMDEREVARLAADEIGRRVRDEISGVQADLEATPGY